MLLQLVNFIVTGIAFITIFLAVAINFMNSNPNGSKKQKKSFVETGTMTVFFVFFYLVIRFSFGKVNFPESVFLWTISFVCWVVIILGIYFNIFGRILLGKNWANQIKIYSKHTLVTKGVYKIVRHPLYASLIWIFYACSILYLNWIAFLLNTLIFVPMMYYRARQEEKLLQGQFKNYSEYKNKVGMFFPKLRW